MGNAREPKPAKFFVGLLSSSQELLSQAENDLLALMGQSDGRSAVLPWNLSPYYEREMGSGLLRCFVGFSPLLPPDRLAELKLKTQVIEDRYRNSAGARRINVDPGYLDTHKAVLASTKNASQRIYLRSGIYAEATLFYDNGHFHGLAYTYRDYLWPEALVFFSDLRAAYLKQLKQLA
ncbi:MAG TPA: DUF4416 family protein [Candidatus Binatia bacterium]|jgi:hypothetical protein